MSNKSRREFAKAVRGEHTDTIAFQEYVLAQLRCSHMRARLYVNEIELIGVALKGGIVDAETALQMMHEAGTLDFLIQAEEPPVVEAPSNDKWPEESDEREAVV